jgi:hypothetical protein
MFIYQEVWGIGLSLIAKEYHKALHLLLVKHVLTVRTYIKPEKWIKGVWIKGYGLRGMD